MQKKDSIFSSPMEQVSDFCFDETVAEVFPDMIQRSVPGYQTIIQTIGQLASEYVTADSTVYDLGCSLGAASLSVARHTQNIPCQIVGIDNSEAMIERCERIISSFNVNNPISLRCESALDTKMKNASMVIMNFTLQFIPPAQRFDMLKRVYDALTPGGILVLSEKIRHPSTRGNELLVDLHHQFKRQNGYSELEVSQKRAALENVMLTDTFKEHEIRLKTIGFDDVVMWFKCFNFTSLIAIKGPSKSKGDKQ